MLGSSEQPCSFMTNHQKYSKFFHTSAIPIWVWVITKIKLSSSSNGRESKCSKKNTWMLNRSNIKSWSISKNKKQQWHCWGIKSLGFIMSFVNGCYHSLFLMLLIKGTLVGARSILSNRSGNWQAVRRYHWSLKLAEAADWKNLQVRGNFRCCQWYI